MRDLLDVARLDRLARDPVLRRQTAAKLADTPHALDRLSAGQITAAIVTAYLLAVLFVLSFQSGDDEVVGKLANIVQAASVPALLYGASRTLKQAPIKPDNG